MSRSMLDPATRVAGIVLAAGQSTRMGRNKLLLDIGGEPLVRRSVQHALSARLSPVLVVVGFEADHVQGALAGLSYEAVLNPEFERGINRSVQRGVARVPPDCAAAVVTLADMPFVSSTMIAWVVNRYRETHPPLVISLYGDVQAPPTLYERSVFAEFGEDAGEGCGKRVVRRHRERAAVVQWPIEALADIDRPEDYATLEARVTEASR